jgi:multidrug efflux pump subunit AcrA (membrane-fusion protein)
MEARDPFDGLKPLQYRDIYHEDDAPLADVRKNALRLLTCFLLLISLLFVALGSTVRLTRIVSYKFVLRGNEEERVLRFDADIYLNEKYVSVGQTVVPGDPLLRVSLPQIVRQQGINQRETLNREKQAAYEKIIQTYGDASIEKDSIILKATSAGKVSYLLDADQDVSSGTVILKLKEANNALYAFSRVPPENIGLIRENARLILRVSAFPHYQWGLLEGRIRLLSLTPDELGNYPFEAEITNPGKLKGHLQVGMDGELSLPLEEKSFFGYIFEKIHQGYDGRTEPAPGH